MTDYETYLNSLEEGDNITVTADFLDALAWGMERIKRLAELEKKQELNMGEYKRLTEKSVGSFKYDLANYTHKVKEFNDYDAFFAYSMAVKRLGELEDEIENGDAVILPCIVVSMADIYLGELPRVPSYQVLWKDKNGRLQIWRTTDKEAAEQRLAELRGEK